MVVMLICVVLIDIELVARTDGIRVLLHALAEGPLEMAPLLSSAFLYIADSPRTRAYLHPGTDLEVCETLWDPLRRDSILMRWPRWHYPA